MRAAFNFAKKKRLAVNNATEGIDFFPEKKKLKYIPSPEDVDKVIASAGIDVQDYLWAIKDTAARMGEINRLIWEDVNLEQRFCRAIHPQEERGPSNPQESTYDPEAT